MLSCFSPIQTLCITIDDNTLKAFFSLEFATKLHNLFCAYPSKHNCFLNTFLTLLFSQLGSWWAIRAEHILDDSNFRQLPSRFSAWILLWSTFESAILWHQLLNAMWGLTPLPVLVLLIPLPFNLYFSSLDLLFSGSSHVCVLLLLRI